MLWEIFDDNKLLGSKYTEEDWSQKLMTIDEFIDKFIINEKNTGYLAQHPLFDQVRYFFVLFNRIFFKIHFIDTGIKRRYLRA